ncbi:MAG TPA: segregation/condensation protein A [Candidatus Eisenbacteria bacterium]|nr:segregation/condensation protein A [Candidatus Eisenbacteria bacterium]
MKNQFLEIQIKEYESPLDLIYHLLEVNRVDIYDIPIFDITEQYLSVLEKNSLAEIDMELASEFLVMAASLMQIKSRMLLPQSDEHDKDQGISDPREELVLRLLAYRRNKYLAIKLENYYKQYEGAYLKTPSLAKELGLSIKVVDDRIDAERFTKAITVLSNRNKLRFNEQNQRIRQLVKREKFSVKSKMIEVIQKVFSKTRVFFTELFPKARTSKAERVSGFLAILELIRQDKLIVKQPSPFAVMMIELEPEMQRILSNEQKEMDPDLDLGDEKNER